VAFFEQALDILEADGPRDADLATAIDLVFDLRASLAPLGEFTRTLGHLRRAETRAETLGDRRRLGWVSAYLTQSYYTLGEQAAAIRSAERAREIGDALGDAPLRIAADFGLGQAHHVLGDYRLSERHLRRAVAAVAGPLGRERWGMAGLVSVAARIWLAGSLADVGEFVGALTVAREGLALAEAADHPWSIAGIVMALGFVHLSQGHEDEAAPVLDRGIAFSREMDLTAWLPMLLCARGVVDVRSGRVAEGVRLLEDGVARAGALRILSRHALRLTWLAEGYLRAERAEAAATVREAHRLASMHGEKGYAAGAQWMLGEVTGDPRLYADALAAASALGMRPLEALCHLGLGTVARRAGDGAPAKEELTTAVGLLREMDMRHWLAQARAELAAL
jgi:tetratricopeptide (TPR) repeat protein